ncbi:sensor histidine kinase [Pontibacter locisalis]|uniref:histidine kinase n=1 Tax=Pontibacter locisalis TaxID=1719035 RepID=A0ABW5IPJ4_9BACT
MKKYTIIGVIVLMSISLLGVVGLQLYWINDAIKVRQEQFDRAVNNALIGIVNKLETHEAVTTVTDQMADLSKSADSTQISAFPSADPVSDKPVTKKEHIPEVNKSTADIVKENAGTNAAPFPAATYFEVKGARKMSFAKAEREASAGSYQFFSIADSAKVKQALKSLSGTRTTIIPSTIPGNTNHYQRIKANQTYSLNIARLRKGKILQLEHDTVHNMIRYSNKPFKVSADSLRHIAIQLDSLSRHVEFSNVFRPVEVASIDVRNDSIFIYRKDKNNPIIYRSSTESKAEDSKRTSPQSIYFRERYPSKNSGSPVGVAVVPSHNEKRTSEPKSADRIKVSKVPNPNAKATNIERIEVKKDKLNEVVQKMVVEYVVKDVPLQNRINLQQLPDLIKSELKNQGLDMDFGYWVVAGKNDTITVRNVKALNNRSIQKYQASLFPSDIFDKQDHLGLYFPDSKAYAIKSIWGMLALSVFFTFVIVATFGTTIHIIYKQKKLSEMKNDFINNMTHEFKTPIATISLATDSIANPKVYEKPEKIQYYTNIIRQENKRMNAQVENVLQIALLEKNEFKMKLEPVDLHVLIIKAIESVRLQVEQRLGNIQLHLEAAHSELHSDEVHLYNVICNLLDNANKYSPASPDINLTTRNVAGGIMIAVDDKGMGMSKDTQQRVFEKFYRVPTGNLHNIKGFGLGLSYVKAIVEAHHGNVRLWSELGKGSRFEIFLPISKS